MKKTLICLAVAAGALAAPALSFAQSESPITRAQVRADLVRLERAGYQPGRGEDVNYPSDVQAAEATVARQGNRKITNEAAEGNAQTSAASSGESLHTAFNKGDDACVGPVSYCVTYFGS